MTRQMPRSGAWLQTMSRFASSNIQRILIFCGATAGSFLLSSLILRCTVIKSDPKAPKTTVRFCPPLRASCQEASHLVFVKVPKSGSTTIQNVLFRFGLSRNLTFMLPRINNWLSHSRVIDERDIFPTPDGKYDIICNHVKYNKTDLRRFTKKDATKIGIIREPGSHLKSYLYYYHSVYLNLQHSTEVDIESKFLKHTEKHKGKILANPISDWFSLIPEENSTTNLVTKFKVALSNLDEDFTLVLVMERFDESMVLMKRLLCWNLEDIIYIPRNENRMYPRGNLSLVNKLRHEHTSTLDYILYNHFASKLDSVIRQGGEDFKEEVRFFKNAISSVKKFCKNWRSSLGSTLEIASSPWSPGFKVTALTCLLLTYSEIELQNYVGLWQYGDVWSQLHHDS